MKLFGYIIVLIFFGFFTSCKEESREMKIDRIMSGFIDSTQHLDKKCLFILEESFVKYGVWPEDTKLIEGAEIFLNQKTSSKLNYYLEDKFLSFLFETGEDLIYETYLYSDYSNYFIPIHMDDQYWKEDSITMVRLYFEHNNLDCEYSFLKGTSSNSLKKNGIFKKQVNN